MTDSRPMAATGAEPMNGWPKDVRPISLETLGFLGVDADGNLYWDGKLLEVRQSITLTLSQKAWAGLIGVSAIAGAVAAGFSAYADIVALP